MSAAPPPADLRTGLRLRIAPFGEGAQWLRDGARAFMRQPLALSGQALMLMALLGLIGLLPAIGPVLALALLPVGTVAFMAATVQATQGRFAAPDVLLTALRGPRAQVLRMLQLGLLYAACGIALILISHALLGQPPEWPAAASANAAAGQRPGITAEMVNDSAFRELLHAHVRHSLLQALLYLPLSLIFWHAPALTHWHGLSPLKSLFFSAVAVLRNWRAFTAYALALAALLLAGSFALTFTAALLGQPALLMLGVAPLSVLLLTIFSASFWFSYQGCFEMPQEQP